MNLCAPLQGDSLWKSEKHSPLHCSCSYNVLERYEQRCKWDVAVQDQDETPRIFILSRRRNRDRDLQKFSQDIDETENFDFGLRSRPRRSGLRPRHFSRPYIQVNCRLLYVFQGYHDDDQFNSRTYSLQLKQTSQEFLALSGIHSTHFQQSKKTTVINIKSTKTVSWPWVAGWLHTEINVQHRELNPDTVTHLSTNRARRRLI